MLRLQQMVSINITILTESSTETEDATGLGFDGLGLDPKFDLAVAGEAEAAGTAFFPLFFFLACSTGGRRAVLVAAAACSIFCIFCWLFSLFTVEIEVDIEIPLDI
jgi:hypothetical protein